MKAKKHYEHDAVIVYVSDGDWSTCLTLENERQLYRLGECLRDLARTGGSEVSVAED